jgi:hypothetical protein
VRESSRRREVSRQKVLRLVKQFCPARLHAVMNPGKCPGPTNR